MPTLSILVPTYNRAAYLKQCLDSLLTTTVDCEILVSDNASTDDTAAVAAAFGDPRLRYFRQPENAGVVANHNFLLGQMRGRYFCLFGDDDVALPGCFEDKLALLERYPDVDLVYSKVDLIDHEGRPLPSSEVYGRLPYSYVGGRDEFLSLLTSCYIAWQGVVFRRAVYDAVGPLAADHWGLFASMDWYWLQLCTRGRRVAFIDAPTVRYRIHAGALSREAERGGHFQDDRFTIWRKWLLEADDPPVLDDLTWRTLTQMVDQEAKAAAPAGGRKEADAIATFEALRAAYEARMTARFLAATAGDEGS